MSNVNGHSVHVSNILLEFDRAKKEQESAVTNRMMSGLTAHSGRPGLHLIAIKSPLLHSVVFV